MTVRTPLLPTDQAYQEVSQRVKETLRCTIHRIDQLTQHPISPLYETMKAILRNRNGARLVHEKHLFHGCSDDVASRIATFGFNRAYCQPRAAYGQAIYFAEEARYSAHKKYAKYHDELTKVQTLIQAKVLLGRSAAGKPDFLEPPMMKDGIRRYDSTSGLDDHCHIVAVYDDVSSLPEYIIHLKKY